MTIVLTDSWHKQAMARAVPGAYWSPADKAWVLDDADARAAAVVCKLFPDVAQANPDLVELRNSLLVEVRPFDNATPYAKRIGAPRVAEVLAGMGWSFHDYQGLDLGYVGDVLDQHGGAYIGWDRGLGKTLATCALIDALDAQRTLVVAPNTAKESVWAAELRRFCPWAEVHVLPNDKAKRERLLAGVRDLYPKTNAKPLVLVVHYEALALIAGISYKRKGTAREYVGREHLKPTLTSAERNRLDEDERRCYRKVMGKGWDKLGEWDLFVADEAHRLANPDAQMTRAAKKVPAAKRLALSGSIIQNRVEELFSPLQWLFPASYKSAWRDWNDRFLDYVDGGYGKICLGVKPHMVETMRAELGVFMVYRRKEDELDLPERVDHDVRVPLSAKQRKAYDKLVSSCMATLEDGTTLKADEGASMMNKLRQVATGLDLLTDEIVDSSKLDLAVELIEDSPDDDFVVFSWYKSAVHALADRLAAKKIQSFQVTGDVPHAKRAEAIARFQAGEGRVFIGTIATLGESVNLQRANQVIMLDRSFNPALNGQAVDRAYRQGQRRRVTVTNIIAKDTVDELNVLPTLASKEALRAAILGGI